MYKPLNHVNSFCAGPFYKPVERAGGVGHTAWASADRRPATVEPGQNRVSRATRKNVSSNGVQSSNSGPPAR
jgi:hypothetical protein